MVNKPMSGKGGFSKISYIKDLPRTLKNKMPIKMLTIKIFRWKKIYAVLVKSSGVLIDITQLESHNFKQSR